MCFFDQHRFACGDWKWGHFRQHCNREYRTGETCDMKLVMQTYEIQQKCKICEKIDTKRRRLANEQDRIHRWAREHSRYDQSIEKSREIIAALDTEIYELGNQRRSQYSG